jgi:VWFA-related protein
MSAVLHYSKDMRVRLLIVAAVFAAPALAAPQVPTIHAETRVVQIEINARDPKGHAVTDLQKNDFVVMDEGKPRVIDIFSNDRDRSNPALQGSSNMPRPGATTATMPPNVFTNRNPTPPVTQHSTVILLDHVNGDIENATLERQGVLDLLKNLRGDERIAIYVIGNVEGLILVQDYTTDRDLLLKSMREYVPRYLNPPTFPQMGGFPPIVPLVKDNVAEDVRLAFQTLAEHLALVPGRKSVFWVTHGFPASIMHGPAWEPRNNNLDPTPPWQKTIATLNEADVAVNAVDTDPALRYPANGPALLMKQLSEVTGGKGYFYGAHDMGKALEAGIADSHSTYTLGFYLADEERDDKLHNLKVTTTRPGVQLFYRQGYYAGTTELPSAKPENDEIMETALLNPVNSRDVGITAKVDAVPGKPRGVLHIRLQLDPNTLSLRAKSGDAGNVETGRIDEMFLELNEAGGTLAKVSDTKDFEFNDAARRQYEQSGVSWPISIPLFDGAVRLAIVVRDSATGKVGSLNVPIQ